MNYYGLYSSLDPTVVGEAIPQVQELVYPTTRDHPKALGRLLHQKASVDTQIPLAILAKKAQKTDLMSASHFGNVLLSDRLKNQLDLFKVFGVEFLPTSLVSQDRTKYKYWFTNVFHSGYQFLDFQKSSFARMASPTSNIILKEETFYSCIDFENALQEQHQHSIHVGIVQHPLYLIKPVFKDEISLDLCSLEFLFQEFSMECIVSENLKSALEQENYTGLVFKEL